MHFNTMMKGRAHVFETGNITQLNPGKTNNEYAYV